jgi:hypothetical protein
MVDKLRSKGTLEEAEIEMASVTLCSNSHRMSVEDIRRLCPLLQSAEAQLSILAVPATRDAALTVINAEEQQERMAGKLHLSQPAPVELPRVYEQRIPSAFVGGFAAGPDSTQHGPLAAQRLHPGLAAAQGQQQLPGQQPDHIQYNRLVGVLGAGRSNDGRLSDYEVVGGGLPAHAQQPVPAARLQQQLQQGNPAAVDIPAYYEQRLPSGFASGAEAGGNQCNPLKVQQLLGPGPAQGQQQLPGQQRQLAHITYDRRVGVLALGAGSSSGGRLSDYEVVGGGLPAHAQQPLAVPAARLQQQLLQQGNLAAVDIPAYYEQRVPSGFAGGAEPGGNQCNPLKAQQLLGPGPAQGQQQLPGQQRQQPAHITYDRPVGVLGAGSSSGVRPSDYEVVGGGLPAHAQQPVPAACLQQQLQQGNPAAVDTPVYYEQRLPSGFAGGAEPGGNQCNPLKAQQLLGPGPAQGQQQLPGQQRQPAHITYDRPVGAALGAGSSSGAGWSGYEVVGGVVPGHVQQCSLPPSQHQPLACAEGRGLETGPAVSSGLQQGLHHTAAPHMQQQVPQAQQQQVVTAPTQAQAQVRVLDLRPAEYRMG